MTDNRGTPMIQGKILPPTDDKIYESEGGGEYTLSLDRVELQQVIDSLHHDARRREEHRWFEESMKIDKFVAELEVLFLENPK